MKSETNSGFTLIELLVVIAIIGMLSSVVLASLNSARGKGNDAAIKSTLTNMRTQAELVYSGDYSFANVCGGSQDAIIAKGIEEVESLNGGVEVVCNSSSQSWAIASATQEGAFCVDADGAANEYSDLEDAITDTNDFCN